MQPTDPVHTISLTPLTANQMVYKGGAYAPLAARGTFCILCTLCILCTIYNWFHITAKQIGEPIHPHCLMYHATGNKMVYIGGGVLMDSMHSIDKGGWES